MKLTNKSRLKIVLLGIAFVSLQANIKPINEIIEIEDAIPLIKEKFTELGWSTKNTNGIVFMTDLDETIFFSRLYEATSQYFEENFKKYRELGLSPNDAIARFMPQHLQAHKITPIKEVDPDVTQLIDTLQKNKIITMGLTARSKEFINLTREELQELGIDFSKNGNRWKSCLLITGLPKDAYFCEGIVYCGGFDKGLVAEQFFQQFRLLPRLVILVDDLRSNLEKVEAVCKKLTIPFLGLHLIRYAQMPQEELENALKRGVPAW